MDFEFRNLWRTPAINPITKKALSVPVLNPIDKYGRTFYFSTFGFMVAFLSWYAFPPLMTKTIKKDLHLSQAEIANSNIIALVATLVVRVIVGPLCDRFGPRLVFAGVLLAGSLPTVLAGTVTSATGLIVLRFFVGILGATFVPCQVWSTGFYDKSVVGTANSLMAGIGNSGGGITYFVMPAVFESLVSDQGLSDHVAWRVAFVVPFILITAMALGMIFLCEDTPTGPWAERHLHVHENFIAQHNNGFSTVDKPGDNLSAIPAPDSKKSLHNDEESNRDMAEGEVVAQNEVVQKPSLQEAMGVVFCLPTLLLASSYATTFGAELSVNSILGSYYAKNFPYMGQSTSGAWAAMFGILNVAFRPIGGLVSDHLYRATGSVIAKKLWLIFLNVIMGCFCLAIGLTDSHNQSTLIGLFAGMAFFMEAGNGANFALVPHAHPSANGIVSGIVGASGNLGGIVYAIIFRYNGVDYGKAIWIIGAITIGINIFISWINPIPRGQLLH